MRTFIFSLAASLVVATPALAEPFSGPYVGAEVSRDAYEVKADDLDVGGFLVSADGLSGNGIGGGIFAGYDYAIGAKLFIGVEANLNTTGASISASGTDGVDSLSAEVKARESYGASARFGAKLNGNTGLYARVGWLNTKFNTNVVASGTSLFSDKRTEDALVYGAGLETFLDNNVSLRVEYTISDYGSAGLNADLGVNGISVDNNKLTLGASYHF